MAAAVDMSAPYKGVHRVHTWDESVEENYRFQCAGFRDLFDFEHSMNNPQEKIDRWPHNGFIKKLVRKDGCFMYFNKSRECIDKEVHKVKLYKY
ncbi:meiosis expressed gene 1 protein homolog [Symsagittifera roscoffensis]|uniref:meiosis expressed gene 1 protein homolog n=1 Tax=Symsagittifera roscoffensis TaxID=84072 RepID=UPI00307B2E14